jgi:hypothetical protein
MARPNMAGTNRHRRCAVILPTPRLNPPNRANGLEVYFGIHFRC